MLILLLCTHIWDPHKLSTKQIIGHIAPKKNHNVWSPTVWKTRHKSTGILYHTLLGVLLESLQKKGKKNRAQIHTWNNGLLVLKCLTSQISNLHQTLFLDVFDIPGSRGFFFVTFETAESDFTANDVNVNFSSRLFST